MDQGVEERNYHVFYGTVHTRVHTLSHMHTHTHSRTQSPIHTHTQTAVTHCAGLIKGALPEEQAKYGFKEPKDYDMLFHGS